MARRSRLSQAQRGYGVTHVLGRRHYWKPRVDAGLVNCGICGLLIEPGSKWHLDHTDDRGGWRGPAHARCNVVEAGLKSQRLRRGETTVTSRQW